MKKKVKFNSYVQVKYFDKDEPIYNKGNSKKKNFFRNRRYDINNFII